MARPGLTSHRKFRRLGRVLGSPILARGVLELLWEACYESGDDYLGTAEDIDHQIGWTGERGIVALALVSCGLPEGHGFIEPIEADAGKPPTELRYRVHDLWHHAPDYVRKRHQREMERRQRDVPVTTDRRTAPNGSQCPPSRDSQTEGDRTPAPAPAPAPAHVPTPPDGAATDRQTVVARFKAEYPSHRLKDSYLVDSMIFDAVSDAGGIDSMLTALRAYKSSEQWQTPKLVPNVETWISGKKWRYPPVPATRPPSAGTIVNAEVSPAVAARMRLQQERGA